MAYVHGKSFGIQFTPSGGSAQTIRVLEHGWQEEVDTHDITHDGSGGVQAMLPGILRGTAPIKFVYDDAAAFYTTTVGIRAGNIGVLTHTVSSGKSYTIPVIIKSVDLPVVINGAVIITATMEMNSNAGTYAYPS